MPEIAQDLIVREDESEGAVVDVKGEGQENRKVAEFLDDDDLNDTTTFGDDEGDE